jgi:hypothetical protein
MEAAEPSFVEEVSLSAKDELEEERIPTQA